MSDFSYYMHNVKYIAIICAAIIGIIFWKKQKTKESIVLTSGILIVALGALIQLFTIIKQTFNYFEYGTSSGSEILFVYDVGSVISSIGLVATVAGFALVTWKIKRNT